MQMRFLTLPNFNSLPNAIWIDWKFCEIIGAQVFAFWNTPVTLHEGQGYQNCYQNVEFSDVEDSF